MIELNHEKEKNEKNKKLYNNNINAQKELNDNYNKLLIDYKQLNTELTQEKLNSLKENEKYMKLNDDYDEIKNELNKEKINYEELNNKYINNINSIKILEEKNLKLEEEIKTKNKSIKKLEEEKNLINKNNNNINNLIEINKLNNDSEINLLKYNELKEKYESLTEKNEKDISELNNLKEELIESKKSYKILNDEKVKLKADILEMKADFKMDKNQFEKKIASLEKQISAKNNLIEEIKNNKDKGSDNDLLIINLRKKNNEIQNENILLKEELKQQNDEMENLNFKIDELNQKLNFKNKNTEFANDFNMNVIFDKNKNYDYVKCYQLTDKLRWYLIKKEENEEEQEKAKIIKYKNKYLNSKYESFIWLSEQNLKQLGIDDLRKYNVDKDIEKSPKILEGKIKIKFNFRNFNNQKEINDDKILETLEKLKNENKYLNKIILKYKTETNMMDISNIKDEIDDSILTEDKCFEDLLDDDLDTINNAAINNPNNNNVNNIYNIHNNNNNMKIYFGSGKNQYSNRAINNNKNINLNLVKDSIDSLMTQIKPNQTVKGTIGIILKQLGCSEDDIGKLLEDNNKI